MKGFKIMFEQTKRFYLAIFLCALLYVVLDCTYICNDNQIVSIDTKKIELMENSLKTQDAVTVFRGYVMSLDGVVFDKVSEELGLALTLLLIGVALFVKEYAFTDSRTREFRQMWPVKSWVREIYHYSMMLGTILLSFFIQMVFLLLAQNRYNNMLISYLGLEANQTEVREIIALNSSNLIITMVVAYVLPVVANYTWIYLGMIVAKNPLVGIVLSMVVKGAFIYLNDTVLWLFVHNTFLSGERQVEEQVHIFASNTLDVLSSSLMESEIEYYFFNWRSTINGLDNYGNYYDPLIMRMWIWVKVVSIFVFVLCILYVAKKKELSKGGLFYFPILNIPFSLAIGIVIFVIFIEECIYWSNIAIVGAILGCFVLTIVVFLLIHPVDVNKTKRLEVK